MDPVRAAETRPETLHVFPISTRRGHAGVIAMLFLVAAGVTIFMGAPPGIESLKWPMIIVGVLALAGALVLHQRRRRRLVITRSGEQHYLSVEREPVRLWCPLGVSGDQMNTRVDKLWIYDVWLKLVDRDRGCGILLAETRGAACGPERNWLIGIDKTVSCEPFDARKFGELAKLLAVVKGINAQYERRT